MWKTSWRLNLPAKVFPTHAIIRREVTSKLKLHFCGKFKDTEQFRFTWDMDEIRSISAYGLWVIPLLSPKSHVKFVNLNHSKDTVTILDSNSNMFTNYHYILQGILYHYILQGKQSKEPERPKSVHKPRCIKSQTSWIRSSNELDMEMLSQRGWLRITDCTMCFNLNICFPSKSKLHYCRDWVSSITHAYVLKHASIYIMINHSITFSTAGIDREQLN